MIGVPVARILGIEIRLQFGWVIVLAAVAVVAATQVAAMDPEVHAWTQWLLGGSVALGFLVSALVHDLSHAVVARRRGVDVRSIVVSFFGGATPLDPTAPRAGDDLAIAVAGPAVSVALGAVLAAGAAGLGTATSLVLTAAGDVLAVLAVLNLLLGIVNVVPAYPLDGGRIVRGIVWRRTGDEGAGWRAAAASGRVMGFLLIAAGIALMLLGEAWNGLMVAFSGWFLILSSRAIRERIRIEGLLAGLRVEDVMETDAPVIGPHLTVDVVAGQLMDPEASASAVAVVDAGRVVGVLGARQLRRLRRAAWGSTTVEAAMVDSTKLHPPRPTDSLISALARLTRSDLDALPVVDDDGHLVGLLSRRSVGRAYRRRNPGDQAGGSDA